jgi:hypothetical protein
MNKLNFLAICYLMMALPMAQARDLTTITIPVRIHLIKSTVAPGLNAEVSRQEMEVVFETVNLIWKQAAIQFVIESITEFDASAEERYLKASGKKLKIVTPLQKDIATRRMKHACTLQDPGKSMVNLCVVGAMSPGSGGGFAAGSRNSFSLVVWPLSIKGERYPNPATLAHEFGHAISLGHNTLEDIYLMRGAGNNIYRVGRYDEILLADNEIKQARKAAKKRLK